MLESWLQWTCDGCGETEYHVDSNVSRKQVRDELRAAGWQHHAGDLDYCANCVKRGIAARRETSMNA